MTRLNSQLDYLYDTKFRKSECSHFCDKCALDAVLTINEHVKHDNWFTDSYRDLIQKALQAYLQLEGTQGQIAVDRLRAAGAWDNPIEGR